MEIEIRIHSESLKGILEIPTEPLGVVIFAHGSGSSRLSPRNTFVANELHKMGFVTLLFDLLTEEEDQIYENRFNIELLTERLIGVTKWCMENEEIKGEKIGYFGSSTGSAAALSAAAYWGTKISAVVSRGGRPDLTMGELDLVEAPTLLIVGGEDKEVIDLNRKAYVRLGCVKKMETVLGATHLFEEPGALEKVAELAGLWFTKFLSAGVQKGKTTNGQNNGSEQVAQKSSPNIAF